MNLGEFENYVEKNFKMSLDKIFEDIDPNGYTISDEVYLFLDKLNTLYEVKEELNFDSYLRFLIKTDNLCSFDLDDEFIQDQWLKIINEYMPGLKKEALREISYFSFKVAKYWERLEILQFSLDNMQKDERIINFHILEIFNLITKHWTERDENWKNFTEKFLKILNENFIGHKKMDEMVNDLRKVLQEYKTKEVEN